MKTLGLPGQITIHDTTVREGFQREERLIPTDAKLWVVQQLVKAGFKRLEVTNFASPGRLPQFADAENLLRLIRTHRSLSNHLADVEFSAVTINQTAVDRAQAAHREGVGPDRILLVISVSDAYQQANTGMTIDEYWKMTDKCIQTVKSSGMKVCGVINGIWGCPKTGRTDMQKAVAFAQRWLQQGADEIEHADHDGSATPDRIFAYFSSVLDAIPDPEKHVAHFHSTRGWGMANVLAAMQTGITHFESTLGGIGGQPANFVVGVPVAGTGEYYHKNPGLSGLVSTEDLAVMLDGMTIETGLDIDTVISTGGMVERIVGRRLRSESLHSGRIAK
ncbi:MAG TPA: pyruvate carboxyltransferase [Desulfotignum sp.]|nr:pyruvate carboxyltransferase [Desulfotignum sp.]